MQEHLCTILFLIELPLFLIGLVYIYHKPLKLYKKILLEIKLSSTSLYTMKICEIG